MPYAGIDVLAFMERKHELVAIRISGVLFSVRLQQPGHIREIALVEK
jgi:hypothetical protein